MTCSPAGRTMGRPRVIRAERFCQALAEAGVIQEDLNYVRRVVIDVQAGHVVVIYVERFGDERLLNVAMTLEGIEVSSVPNQAGGEGREGVR